LDRVQVFLQILEFLALGRLGHELARSGWLGGGNCGWVRRVTPRGGSRRF
jgi:hypothetical protein